MPVYRPGQWHSPENKPEWSDIAAIGRFSVPVDGGRFERHFHDDHEVWFISGGKAKVFSDGEEHYVQAGDFVLTRAGDVHDVLEVYETLTGFFLETGMPAGGRTGHLHETEADAAGHDVPAAPLPADFPTR
ncbi:mannose-6-phosphate isomerase-like protein (cupin superfamily) [Diaminobutyricimonas aerilata]|uniref:Mannose-6-phosphate isomerase-like protein (Cupin superfamily) n=1 Tax=Diaminobutyricimonas aerilata TaxID=1162967 RepID=A0A2M9CFG7_9MICO|nr:AraC family ligand binding domain-containing protein [Diaminobutyricimonas aerilata]PJJ70686.1 mannose-6-phosphate isomerase-like protein (cupin superfamily) [Diaminobutyricimonas aerilata]